ncbi:MAG: hypothetical protein V4538_16175 [Bacteroidota bacterium]
MEYLKIQNSGELDVRLISLMGGSTKQNNKIKIGKFGTGLKYSLAFLVRNNIDFKIFVGEEEIKIDVKKENIQNTEFEILYINNERTSITSTMGLDWEPWMICREIWCNALDEGNAFKETTSSVGGQTNTTTFFIQNTGKIKEVVDDWGNYFITSSAIFETDDFAIYPAKQTLCIYKNGVLIERKSDYKGVFSYDIKGAEINELREYKGYLENDLGKIIKALDKNCVELFLSSLKEGTFEYDMDYDWSGSFNKEWSDTIGNAKVIAKDDFEAFKSRGVEIDESELIIVPTSLFKKLSSAHPHISAVRRADKVNSFHEVIDKDFEHKINIAISMLESCGYEINPELKWITGIFGSANVMAKINIDEKLIMFSTELKRKSQFDIITAIIEENEHFLSGYEDCSRSFQQHFIDLFAKQILEKKQILI